MPTIEKEITFFEFFKKFENYMKPALRQISLPENHRYKIRRVISFPKHKAHLELVDRDMGTGEETLTMIIDLQNIRYVGDSSAFKGNLFHVPDSRRHEFLYLVETETQLSTMPYELVRCFSALLKGEDIPDDETEEEEDERFAKDDDLSEEDIENMSDEEIQAMMEAEVAKTLGGAPAEQGGVDDILGSLAAEEAAAAAPPEEGPPEMTVDDIQALLDGGMPGGDEPAPEAAEDEVGSQDELNSLLGDLGVGGPAMEEAPAEAPAPEAKSDDEEQMSVEDIENLMKGDTEDT